MKMPNSKFKLFLCALTSFTFSNHAFSTHVVGGGITYEHIEGFNYRLTVKLYRDCSPGTYQMPNSINLQFRRGDGTLPSNSVNNLPRIQSDTISPSIPACTFDPGICVEEGVFSEIVSIPPGLGGYHLYFTICCRNGTILNINNPLGAQETFYAYMPDVNQSGNNSSPFFNNLPPVYVCAGENLNLNFSATDYDGDSLAYSFYTPYDGNAGTGITYLAGTPPNNINISPVTWLAGFGANDPLDATPGLIPGLTLSATGQINGVPTIPGQYVVGVMVDEYRNGILIGRITRDFQFNVLNCPPSPVAGIDVMEFCNGLNIDFINTSVAATTYWWDFGTGNIADTSTFFQPSFLYSNSGNYTVTLITQKGTECADTATFFMTIEDLIQFTVSTDSISCNGFANGSASINSNTYSYLWSTGYLGTSINNLGPASYWVEATSSIGCIDTQYFSINEPTPLQVSFIETEPLCNGDQNGAIEAIGSGGTAPFFYYWPSQVFYGNTLSTIGAGAYGLTFTDNNGCSLNEVAVLSQPAVLDINLLSLNNVSCFGFDDGNAEVIGNGGSQPYSVDWLALANDSVYMENLAPDNYIVELIDANNCSTALVLTISEPLPVSVEIVIIDNETCSGNNGSAFADITNGIGAINFTWSPSGGNQDFLMNLSAGPVSVFVQDQNGCSAFDNDFIVNFATGIASVVSINPVTCQNGSNGSIEVGMTGGNAPFNYNWTCNCLDTNSVNGLTSGNYSVEITDVYGCVENLDFVINELPALQLNIIDSTNPLCYGDSNGQATALALGGTSPYAYSWNTIPLQNSASVSNLSNGSYLVTVTDSNNCIATNNVSMQEPNALSIQTNVISNILCNGDSSGVASAQGAGGTAPYTFYWNEVGLFTDTIYNLIAGHYTVTLTDSNACQIVGDVDIIEYQNVSAEIVYDSIFCPGDVIEFFVYTNGMNNLYDYNWFVDGVLQGTSNSYSTQIDSLSQINFNLVSQINCPTISDSVLVEPVILDPTVLSVIGTPDTICLGGEASIQAVVSDWSNINAIYWNVNLLGAGPHIISPNVNYTYIATIYNICGDQTSDSVQVNLFMPPNVNIMSYATSVCDSVNAILGFEYDDSEYYLLENYWSIYGQNYYSENPTISFDYSVDFNANLTMSFSNGCTFEYSENISVEVFESPEANFYYNPDPAIQMEEVEFIDISHGNPLYWEWYFEGELFATEERPIYVFDQAGEFSITEIIIDENGCSDTIELLVNVIGDFTVYVPNAFTPDGNGFNNTFKPIFTNVKEDDYLFQIFNRWGELIFEADYLDAEWAGAYMGEMVQDGVYVYKILLKDNRDVKHEYVGQVTLLR